MQRRSLLAAAGAAATIPFVARRARAQTGNVVGAGSSLPRAVFAKWIEMAGAEVGLKLTYSQTGAAPALEQLKARAIDFASVDYPRKVALLREHKLTQFPTLLTGVVPVANLPGVADGQLRLTGELLADIYLGKITKWDDPKVKAHNVGVNLPNLPVVPVHRSESSGSAMLLTSYLTRTSEAWAAGPRAGTLVQWPAGVGLEVTGSDALVAKVKATPGAIGYGGVATAKANQLASVALQNRAGEFVKADMAGFTKAAGAADWNTPGFNLDLVDTEVAGAWPIMGANFVLVPENPIGDRVQAARDAFKFFHWAFRKGGGVLEGFGCAAIPQGALGAVEGVWRRAKDPSGRPIWEA